MDAVHTAGSGHLAGSFSVIDILIYLYYGGILIHHPRNPWAEDRDRLILSNGHVCPALYTVLAMRGFFPIQRLQTLRKLHSRLDGHTLARSVPGVEATTGSLGQGVGVACGMAKALLLKKSKTWVFCIISDGELQEGSVWEAFMFAETHNLSNLIFILDKNGIQNSGTTRDITKMEPLEAKLIAFGLHVAHADGHNFDSFKYAITEVKTPGIVIAKTVPGKGVSFMENDYKWHGKIIDDSTYKQALKGLEREK